MAMTVKELDVEDVEEFESLTRGLEMVDSFAK